MSEQFLFHLCALILVFATVTDWRSHKIPNVLSLGGAILALIFHGVIGGGHAVLMGLAGLGLGLVLFLPFYLLRGMAAGDVKLMAAVGACVGPIIVAYAVAASLIAGALLAVLVVLFHRNSRITLARYGAMLKLLVRTGRWHYFAPTEGDVARQRFPYAIAILAGTAFATWWQTGVMLGGL